MALGHTGALPIIADWQSACAPGSDVTPLQPRYGAGQGMCGMPAADAHPHIAFDNTYRKE